MGGGSQARAGKGPQQPASLSSGQPGPAPRRCQQRALRPGPPHRTCSFGPPSLGPQPPLRLAPGLGAATWARGAGDAGSQGEKLGRLGFRKSHWGWVGGSAWLGAQAPGLRTSRSGEELGGREAGTPGSLAGRGPVEQRDWRLLRLRIGCAARPLAQRDPMLASGGRKLVLMLPSVGVAGMRRREQPP